MTFYNQPLFKIKGHLTYSCHEAKAWAGGNLVELWSDKDKARWWCSYELLVPINDMGRGYLAAIQQGVK